MLIRALFFLLLLIALAPATAQTTPPDTLPTAPLETLQEINRGPRRALLWAIIPGGGQVYNRRWWKVPVVYGGLLGAIAVADFNQTRYRRFVEALENRCLGDGFVITPPFATCQPGEDFFPGTNTDAIIRARDAADQGRQYAWLGIAGVYILQAVEAYTDAQLMNFDISDDLSFRLTPSVEQSDLGAVAGAGVVVRLGSGRRRKIEEARVAALSE